MKNDVIRPEWSKTAILGIYQAETIKKRESDVNILRQPPNSDAKAMAQESALKFQNPLGFPLLKKQGGEWIAQVSLPD